MIIESQDLTRFFCFSRLLPFSTSIAIGVPSSTYVCSKNWITELSALRPKATKTFLLPFPSQRHIFLRQEGKITLYLNDRTTGTVPFTLVSQILVKTSRAMTRRGVRCRPVVSSAKRWAGPCGREMPLFLRFQKNRFSEKVQGFKKMLTEFKNSP